MTAGFAVVAGPPSPAVTAIGLALAADGIAVFSAADDPACQPTARLVATSIGGEWVGLNGPDGPDRPDGIRAVDSHQTPTLFVDATPLVGEDTTGPVLVDTGEPAWIATAELPVTRTLLRLQAFHRGIPLGARTFLLALPHGLLPGEAGTAARTAAAHGQLSLVRSAAARWRDGKVCVAAVVVPVSSAPHGPSPALPAADTAPRLAPSACELLGFLADGRGAALSGQVMGL